VKPSKIHTLKYSTIQRNTVLYIIAQYNIVSYSTIQRYTIETLLY